MEYRRGRIRIAGTRAEGLGVDLADVEPFPRPVWSCTRLAITTAVDTSALGRDHGLTQAGTVRLRDGPRGPADRPSFASGRCGPGPECARKGDDRSAGAI